MLSGAESLAGTVKQCVPMKLVLALTSILVLLGACATRRGIDTIEQVAQALAQTQADAATAGHSRAGFNSGLSVTGVFLPSNAPPSEVARESIKEDDWFAYAPTNVSVVAVRRVRICGTRQLESVAGLVYDPIYTAVLLNTSFGQRVVILQFFKLPTTTGAWMHWTFDPKKLLNQARQPTPQARAVAHPAPWARRGCALCWAESIEPWRI